MMIMMSKITQINKQKTLSKLKLRKLSDHLSIIIIIIFYIT